MLRAIAEYSKNDRAEFIRTVQETQAAQQTADISRSGNGWLPPQSGPGNWKG